MTVSEFIRDRINISDTGCWEWTSYRNGDGYGTSWFQQKWKRAHRLSYEAFVGPIPDGLTLDHLCRVRHCVNPEHLEPVTAKENILRSDKTWGGRNSQRKRCPHGHLLDGVNARGRYCTTCNRLTGLRIRESIPTYGRLERECKNGHPRTDENTEWSRDGSRRRCRVCRIAQKQKG